MEGTLSNLVHTYFTCSIENLVMYVVETANCATVFVCICLFLERGEGREKERERISHFHNPATCPVWELNQRTFGSQSSGQSSEPHQAGLIYPINAPASECITPDF